MSDKDKQQSNLEENKRRGRFIPSEKVFNRREKH